MGSSQIESLVDEFRRANYDDRDGVKAKLRALGEPARKHLLTVALKESEQQSFRQAVIYFLVVEQRYEAAFTPLFDRYVKGKDPKYLYRNDDEGFGLFREVVGDLEAIGLELR